MTQAWPIKSTHPDGHDIRPALRACNIQIVEDNGSLLHVVLPPNLTIQFPGDGSYPQIRGQADNSLVITVCYPLKS